jgi:ketosteroid isomerase-like protein
MLQHLDPAIRAYFDAANRQDTPAVVACFANDAVVYDEGHVHRGTDAIRVWKERVSQKYQATAEPTSVTQDGDETVVTAQVSGNFPGSPAPIRFRFIVVGNTLTSLRAGS